MDSVLEGDPGNSKHDQYASREAKEVHFLFVSKDLHKIA